MPRVALRKDAGIFEGRAVYQDGCLYTEGKNLYNQDRWVFYIDRFCVTCSADKQIMYVEGYLPDLNWEYKDSICVPEPLPRANFLIKGEFDVSGRDGSEDAVVNVEFSRQQAVARIAIAGTAVGTAAKVFVSPHENLLVGATDSEPMFLTEFILLGVTGVDHL